MSRKQASTDEKPTDRRISVTPLHAGDREESEHRPQPGICELRLLYKCRWCDTVFSSDSLQKNCQTCHGVLQEIADKATFFSRHPELIGAISWHGVHQVIIEEEE